MDTGAPCFCCVVFFPVVVFVKLSCFFVDMTFWALVCRGRCSWPDNFIDDLLEDDLTVIIWRIILFLCDRSHCFFFFLSAHLMQCFHFNPFDKCQILSADLEEFTNLGFQCSCVHVCDVPWSSRDSSKSSLNLKVNLRRRSLWEPIKKCFHFALLAVVDDCLDFNKEARNVQRWVSQKI